MTSALASGCISRFRQPLSSEGQTLGTARQEHFVECGKPKKASTDYRKWVFFKSAPSLVCSLWHWLHHSGSAPGSIPQNDRPHWHRPPWAMENPIPIKPSGITHYCHLQWSIISTISYHIISYHLPIFSGSPPIFLAFPQTNPPAQLRFSTSHLAPPQLILSEWLPRFAPRQPGRFPSQFSDITWMEPILKKKKKISLNIIALLKSIEHIISWKVNGKMMDKTIIDPAPTGSWGCNWSNSAEVWGWSDGLPLLSLYRTRWSLNISGNHPFMLMDYWWWFTTWNWWFLPNKSPDGNPS